ncbi:uncharacterized protein LOC132273684 [Cornus florida]|uniref:uncharacterized protein LOC132273684 n=1 Tax=Cornus florida TaxID=4283 RepID=UPI002896707E|nr:uncharacterized protein LOC132273684 [Cornus florida]
MIGLWNVRGLNRLVMQKEVKAWLSDSSIVLCGLVETRVNSSKFQRLKVRIRNNWSWDNNYSADAGGRIWCGWDPLRLDVSVLQTSDQMMLLQVVVRGSNSKFYVTSVYAKNTDNQRKSLWKDLEDSAQFIDGPWLLMVDWNIIRVNEEKKGGRQHPPRVFQDFNQTIDNLCLSEVPTSNGVFTWCNNRHSNRRIYAKLDRSLINEEWGQVFPNSHIMLTPHLTSDHWGLKMMFPLQIAEGPKPFRFLCVWNQQPIVKDMIVEVWKTKTSGDPIKRLLYKLKLTKQAIKDWNKNKFGSVYEEAISCRKKLADIQYQLRDDSMNERLIQIEKEGRMSLEAAISNETILLAQKSRIKWVKEQDRCTKFYFQKIKQHRAKNNITVIQKDGVSITEPSIIKSKFVDHFQRAYSNDQPALYVPEARCIRNKLSAVESSIFEEAITRE